MPTECSATLFEFAPVEGRSVVGAFDGGKITSDAGALLLAATDRAVGLIGRGSDTLARLRYGDRRLLEPAKAGAWRNRQNEKARSKRSLPLRLW